MENLRCHKYIVDFFQVHENEFKVLCSDHDTLQLENVHIKLHYENKLTAERQKKTALSQKIDQLKKKLQGVDSVSADKVVRVKTVSSSAAEAPGQNLEVKHWAQYRMLAAELEVEKKKREVLSQKMMELNHQLQSERDLRAEAEAKAGEAVDIADELLQKLEEKHDSSDEASVTAKTLDAELKTKVGGLHQEILNLNQMLQVEKELRAQAEADSFEAVMVAEALCKEVEDIQRVLKVSKRYSDNSLQKLNTMEKSTEDMANRYMAGKKENDSLRQEIEELLQKQIDLREQNETDSLRDFEILEALCQESADLKRVPKDNSAERQKNSCHQAGNGRKDLLWLIQMLEKEVQLRAQAETDKREAIEVGDALCQIIEKRKVCSRSQEGKAKSAAETGSRPSN